MADLALAEGIDLSFDSYPYLRGSSILSMVALPHALNRAGRAEAMAVLANPAARARMANGWFAARAELWPRVSFSHVPAARFRWLEGMALPEAAARAGLHPAELVCEVLLATELEAGCVFAQPPGASEESVRALLRHRVRMGGSDGIYIGGHPHPRGWGAFARTLRRHVIELADLTWEQAAEQLAARPARRFRLADRGLLRQGHAADVVVLDPEQVADRATYDDPRRAAAGVTHVLVNGVTVLRHGELTAQLPGIPLPR
jgi:N-acyl-D-amino-acid deacylase